MVGSRGEGDGGASRGGIWKQSLTVQQPATLTVQQPATSPASSNQPALTAPSRLFALFEECVNNGLWAKLETSRRRGMLCVDFSCQIQAGKPADYESRRSAKRRAWNKERTKKWREAKRLRRPPAADPPTSTPVDAAGASKSFAEIVAQPASKTANASTPPAVRPDDKAGSGQIGPKMTRPHPRKVAKATLAATRVSQRAALLSKRRAAVAGATTEIPAATPSAADEMEATPEVLRGTEGGARLKSLDISLDASTPPMPHLPPSSPVADPPPIAKSCCCTDPEECTVECEADYLEVMYEEASHGGRYRLSTQKPVWTWVFPIRKGCCRFCKTPLTDKDADLNCYECGNISVFQLIVKYAARFYYLNRD